jgi:hypothetical protein
MKSKAAIFTILISIAVLIQGCFSDIKKFKPQSFDFDFSNYVEFYNPEIRPLKYQWKDLFNYLRKGHIYKHENKKLYIYSSELYRYLQLNHSKFYGVPYLQNYSNFLKVFGEPDSIIDNGKELLLLYFPYALGKNDISIYQHGFSYSFDKETKMMLDERY